MHIVEVCASNRHHGTDDMMKQLEQNPRIELIEYGCLGNCGECWLSPFAMVNGETIAADNPQQLLELIYKTIEKQEADKSALDKLLEEL